MNNDGNINISIIMDHLNTYRDLISTCLYWLSKYLTRMFINTWKINPNALRWLWLRLWLDWWQESLIYDWVDDLKHVVCTLQLDCNWGARMQPIIVDWFLWVLCGIVVVFVDRDGDMC